MSLITNIQNLSTRIATEFKKIYSAVGNLASLSTTEKSSIVGAINEINSKNFINDAAATSTATTFSANKTTQLIAAAKSDIIGGADNAHDTLKEIADLLAADENTLGALNTSIGNRLRFDAAQSLTNAQKAQVATNGGLVLSTDIGDTNTNFVAVFEAALT